MSPDPDFSASRRAFLKLRSQPETVTFRPPWTDGRRIAASCTGCKACVSACPESILQLDQTQKPMVVFDGRECTFCGKCAEACEEPVFDLHQPAPWDLKAGIGEGCLQQHGISCQLCRDSCPTSAIRVDLTKRPFGSLTIAADACTGCGACLGVCPQDVIAITHSNKGREAA
ncbi:ferredoxin-type protein NapF [Roseibium suaedae]|uniref:Periplasmic nitrate reductase maturation protein NapF n=1 Tax=Roseibium suaedae TaxID=735517 RepID=A0A1M7KAR0_9HYPH|nr:ferredoxin-type protein NapF [Roseibium suaedae]SHM62261.1 periplasmic nitrate reductase maturation protein NapF [Roseibium suaedae]